MNEVTVAIHGLFDNLGKAYEIRGAEDGRCINFIADYVDVFLSDEAQKALQCLPVQGGAEWIGWVCYDQALDIDAILPCLVICCFQRSFCDLEIVRAIAVNRNNLDPSAPPQVSIESAIFQIC